jgi:tRNA (adenine57-N1/adenine58-N1)-methyltransferase
MPKILIQRGKKKFFEDMNKEITLIPEKKFFVKDSSKSYSTQFGEISAEDMKKTGCIQSSKGKEFTIFESAFIDEYMHIKRLPQIIPIKDIGHIIAFTGITKDSIVVEGGTGSGALAIMLAIHCKKVYSYEIERENFDCAQENFKNLNIKNVVIKNTDMTKGISQKNVDLICFDLPNPWEAIEPAAKALKAGGFLVNYSPTIMQTADFVNTLAKRGDFMIIKTVEIVERDWEVDGRKVRPVSKSSIHSGFLSFARKIC